MLAMNIVWLEEFFITLWEWTLLLASNLLME